MDQAIADLIAPLDVAAFVELAHGPTPVVVRGGAARQRPLPSWDAFLAAVEHGDVPASVVRLFKNRQQVPDLLYRNSGGLIDGAVRRVMASGSSLTVSRAEACLPAVGELCARLGAWLRDRVSVALVATTGAGGALPPHFDRCDVLVVQIEGAKRWQIEDGPAVLHPALDRDVAEVRRGDIAFDETLGEGDLLFLPGGFRHVCENRSSHSFHAVIGLHPLTPLRALELLAMRVAKSAENRAPIRIPQGDVRAAEPELKARLLALVDSLSLEDIVADHLATPPGIGRI
jgi:ribosomal protein L16 Arg81 hydroxylase